MFEVIDNEHRENVDENEEDETEESEVDDGSESGEQGDVDGDAEKFIYDTESDAFDDLDAAGKHCSKRPVILKGYITQHGGVIKASTWYMY